MRQIGDDCCEVLIRIIRDLKGFKGHEINIFFSCFFFSFLFFIFYDSVSSGCEFDNAAIPLRMLQITGKLL